MALELLGAVTSRHIGAVLVTLISCSVQQAAVHAWFFPGLSV